MRSRRAVLFSLLACSMVGPAFPQGLTPHFDVASIKQNTSGFGASSRPAAGRYSATNQSLYRLILEAYDIPQVTALFSLFVDGRPFPPPRRDDRCDKHCSSTREILNAYFDVNATMPAGAPPSSVKLMLQSLLEQRFHLRIRRETREIPVYALIVASPGKLGPKLHPSTANCREWSSARAAALREADNTGASPRIPAEPNTAEGAHLCTESQFNFGGGGGLGTRGAGVLGDLVSRIQLMDRPVVDRTGLTGNFEWELISGIRLDDGRWLPLDAPPLDTSLREQLGLRLQPQTAASETFTIESVQMPSEN